MRFTSAGVWIPTDSRSAAIDTPIFGMSVSTRAALAFRALAMTFALKRDIPVLAPRIFEFLVLEHYQRAADALARLMRQDHVIDKTACAGHKWIGKAVLVLGLPGGQLD